MRTAGANNFKWSMADVDRITRYSISGMSIEQICAAVAGTRLKSEPEEIEDILRQVAGSQQHRVIKGFWP